MGKYESDLISYLSGFIRPERFELFKRVLENRTRYLAVLLEDIYQSQNASAVLRTCDCTGIQDVHIVENRNVYEINRDVALGSNQWLSLNYYRDDRLKLTEEEARARHVRPGSWANAGDNYIEEAIMALKDKGYRVVATSPHRDGSTPENFDLEKGPALIMFGTELNGLSEIALRLADEYLQIPMVGFTESYNISVSAALTLYSLRKRLERSNQDWRLSSGEKEALLLDWLRASIKKSELIEKAFRKKLDK
ncbi:MAG: RNA methyltransferase [Bacteroidetes bacterium]|nr:MAG: RNA methyltransferase [Bacteroidota bacterium]